MLRTTRLFALVLVLAWQWSAETPRAQAAPGTDTQIDRLFARWSSSTPGCAVAASNAGRVVLSKAYGMADLEHDVPNTPETIFEAGSVAKQFTAAAMLLLARDGRLALDDPVRTHVPELPDYGQPLTIRHMLTHTSGLRDWGSVAAVGGWPRTSRVYTHAHVTEILGHQRALNFTPGTRYSYSNSGYNLAAIIVSRVSGMSFADFTRERIFAPLGMTRTSWRDDHGRIVKGRAKSYQATDAGYRTEMPFENVHGNGGLLTTVGDLLKWNENFVTPKVGDRAFVEEMQQVGRFEDGRAHGYALGLRVGRYHGEREVAHSGSTAGYRAYLARYPDARAGIALLCNASSVEPTDLARKVAGVVLADRLRPAAPRLAPALTRAEVDRALGLYRDAGTGVPLRVVRDGDGLRIERGDPLTALSGTRFATPDDEVFEVVSDGEARMTDVHGSVTRYLRVEPAAPAPAELRQYEGSYASDEAEVILRIAVEGGALVIRRRPDTAIRLTPLYEDAFRGSIGTVIFRRTDGKVTALSVSQERMWDLRFALRPAASTSR